MKDNLITPLPFKQQQALYRWYTLSTIALALLVIGFIILNMHQYYRIRLLRAQQQQLAHTLTTLQHAKTLFEKTKNQKQYIETQQRKLARWQKPSFRPATHLIQVAEHTPQNICLTTCRFSKKGDLSLQGYAGTADAATHFIASLQQHAACEKLMLTALQPHTLHGNRQLYAFACKGTLSKGTQKTMATKNK